MCIHCSWMNFRNSYHKLLLFCAHTQKYSKIFIYFCCGFIFRCFFFYLHHAVFCTAARDGKKQCTKLQYIQCNKFIKFNKARDVYVTHLVETQRHRSRTFFLLKYTHARKYRVIISLNGVKH